MRFILKSSLYLGLLGIIALFMLYIYFGAGLPDVKDLVQDENKQIIEINFSDEELLTSYGNIYRNQVKFYQLPQNLINAVISIEDQKFFTHYGFDLRAMIRAFYVNHKAGKIKQGASTITQQLAKMLFLSPKKTIKRKIQELILAFQLESNYTKEQILTMYLNNAYFGSGNYGIGSAAKYYFKKNVSELTLKESALLAGLLKAPSRLSPKNDPESAEERAEIVIKNMIKWGFVDNNNLATINSDIVYKTNRLQRLYFADLVKENFSDYLNKKDKNKKQITIQTTLNKRVQEKLEDEINKFSDRNKNILQKSEISAIIMKKDGAIIAMSGGKDYQKSQYNRAIYSKRQAGSIFKTFIYATAFENGFSPQDKIIDKKIEFSDWLPNNYNNKYFGEVTLKEAFAKSLNSVAIQLAKEVKIKNIAKLAKKMGISSKIDKNLTMSLGTSALTLYELTSSFATILNNGKPVIPYYINEISDNNYNILYKRNSSGLPEILSDKTILSLKEIMKETVKNGTAKNADVKENIYGKTGTSQNYRDAWFIGFDEKFVIGVWIGNDDNSKTNNISGGSLPAKLFANIISRL